VPHRRISAPRRSIPLCVVVLLLAATSLARADQTDDFLKAQMKAQNIPGLSLAVVRNGEIVKVEGYGVSNIKLATPAKPETVYRIASVSKQFIATGIMLLVQEGKLALDDPVSKYLDGTPDAWKAITIRHLLTHTSGLVREAPGFDPFKIQSEAAVIKTAYPLALRFAPGEKWEYGNLSYFALAEIIRKAANRPWSEYLSEKVFKPSGMTATRAANMQERVPDRAVGYTDNDKPREVPDWPASRPSGAFLSTVLDLAKWDAVLNTDKILTESSRRQIWSPVKLNDGESHPYGLGWYLGTLNGRGYVHHSGGMLGFRARFARFVDDRLTIIILMNLDDVDPDAIVDGVANLHLPAPAAKR
jgi:CubicO group peptidase (beta-lactamase class C family)